MWSPPTRVTHPFKRSVFPTAHGGIRCAACVTRVGFQLYRFFPFKRPAPAVPGVHTLCTCCCIGVCTEGKRGHSTVDEVDVEIDDFVISATRTRLQTRHRPVGLSVLSARGASNRSCPVTRPVCTKGDQQVMSGYPSCLHEGHSTGCVRHSPSNDFCSAKAQQVPKSGRGSTS